MKIEVKNGTVTSKHLCKSCRLAQVMKSDLGEEIFLCGNIGWERMRIQVAECTAYEDKGVVFEGTNRYRAQAWNYGRKVITSPTDPFVRHLEVDLHFHPPNEEVM